MKALACLLTLDALTFLCIGERPLVGDGEWPRECSARDRTSCLISGSSLVIIPAISVLVVTMFLLQFNFDFLVLNIL